MPTRESFVVTSETRFAYATAEAVIEATGTAHNPVLVSGEPGSGKTHLLGAIHDGLPEHEVLLTTARDLAHAPGAAASTDVLAVDDGSDPDDFDAIQEGLAARTQRAAGVLFATRDGAPALEAIREWGAGSSTVASRSTSACSASR